MRRKRLQHGAQLRGQLRILEPVRLVEGLQQRPLLVADRNVVGLFQPLHEARHRRQRDERIQLRQFAPQLLDHLLDQEAAEGNAAKPFLCVRDRIEHRGARAFDRHKLSLRGKQRRDRGRDRLGQRDLDEDQRFVVELGMEEGVAAAVDRIDTAPQIVPVANCVHGFITDDLFQNIRWCRPVDLAQHEKSPVEPRRQQMHHVAVERGQILVALYQGKQVGAHRHQVAGAAGRAVEPPDQLLPLRLGGKVKGAGIAVVRLAAPALDRLRQFFAVGAEVPRQRFEEGKPAGGVEVVVAVEHVARHRGAGGFAPAG